MKKFGKFAIILTLILVLFTVAACAPDEKPVEKAFNGWTGSITTMNPHMMANAKNHPNLGSFVALMAGSGDTKDQLIFVPYHASALPTVSADKKTWTINLRHDLQWSDGTAIDAYTYEYSVQKLLDPKLANLAASNMWSTAVMANGQKYFKNEEGKTCAWADVGFKVKSQYQIEITTENLVSPLDFYVSLGSTIFPVKKDVYEQGMNAEKTSTTYATSLQTTPSCGIFTLEAWVKDQYDSFVKNPNDPLVKAGYIKLDKYGRTYASSNETISQLFFNDAIDIVPLTNENYSTYKNDPRAVTVPAVSTYGFYVNSASAANPVLADANLRKALFYAAPRQPVAEDVYKSYAQANVIFTNSIVVATDTGVVPFRTSPEAIANATKYASDAVKAKELFDKAYLANGSKKITVELMYPSGNSEMERTGVVAQEVYQKLFGADKFALTLNAQTAGVANGKCLSGDYQMYVTICQGNAYNPLAANMGLKRFTQTFKNRFVTGFASDEFDTLMTRCTTGDLVGNTAEVIKSMAKLEDMILDAAVYIPLYASNNTYMYAEKVILPTTVALPVIAYAEYQIDIRTK